MLNDLSRFRMEEALQLAKLAFQADEVPVGATIVLNDEVIASTYNQKERTNDPTAHAEILAIREACAKLNSWHLDAATMYVTLEPCPMCAYAVIQARIKKLVFGAYDPKAGGAGSVVNIFKKKLFNHEVEIVGGVLEEECSLLLKKFFQNRR